MNIKHIIQMITMKLLKKYSNVLNIIEIDAEDMIDNPHEYLAEKLDFPDYYGNNLDALYDCLTEMGGNKVIRILHSEKLKKKIKKTFIDADVANKYINIVFD